MMHLCRHLQIICSIMIHDFVILKKILYFDSVRKFAYLQEFLNNHVYIPHYILNQLPLSLAENVGCFFR